MTEAPRRELRQMPNTAKMPPYARLARAVLTEAFATLLIEVKPPGKSLKEKREHEVKRFFFSQRSEVDTWSELALFDPEIVKNAARKIIEEKEKHNAG
jgi:hypothetical protein